MSNYCFRVLVVTVIAVSPLHDSPVFARAVPLANADVNGDCVITKQDYDLAKASFGKKRGQPGYNVAADVNRDGVINNTDLTFISRNLGKTVCAPAVKPVVTITAPKSGVLTNAAAQTVTGTVSDLAITSGILRVNGVDQKLVIAKGAFAQSVTLLEGVNQLVASATNAAGTGTSSEVTLSVDTQPPSLTVTVPDTAPPGTTVALSALASDVNGVGSISLMVDGAAAGTQLVSPAVFSFAIAGDASAGAIRSLELRATDRAGNTVTLRDTVIVVGVRDTAAPTVLLQIPLEATAGEQIPIIASAQDDGLLMQLTLSRNGTVLKQIDAAPFATQLSFTIPGDASENQVFEFAAQSVDAAGNAGSASAAITVVPATSPTTELHLTVNPPVSPTFLPSTVLVGTIGTQAGTLERQPTPFIASLKTTEGRQGQQLDVVITGANTHFENGLSSAAFGAGIVVESVTAQSETELVAHIVIADDAALGPRLVAVNTGTEEAFLINAFNVRSGVGTLTGRLVTAQGAGIANAQICVPGAALCVLTDGNGAFTLVDVPTTATRFVITAAGFDSGGGALALKLGETAALGSIALLPSTELPPPPPPPGAPTITPLLASAFGRGATLVQEGGDREKLRKLVVDTILAAGGTEIGVLDSNGLQLNSAIVGNGFSSVLDRGARDIAEGLASAEFTTLGELLTVCFMGLKYQAAEPPPLLRVLDSLQQTVNQAWASPAAVWSPMLMALFNQGRTISAQPPRLTADTPLNALQSYLLVTTWFAFLNRNLPPPPGETLPQAASLAPAPPARGFFARLGDATRAVRAVLRPASFSSSVRMTGVTRSGITAIDRLRSTTRATSRATRSASQPADQWPSLLWEEVLVKSKNTLPDHLRNGSVQLCNATQPQPEPGQPDPPPLVKLPGCSETVKLVEILFSTQADQMRDASTRFTGFFTSDSNPDVAARLRTVYEDQSFQDGWRESREQARTIGRAQAFANFSSDVVQGILAKQIGDIANLIIGLEVELIIDSLRPQPPVITSVEQLTDEQGRPAAKVKVTFQRSINDRGDEASNEEHEEHWFYDLWRAGGSQSAIKVATSRFLGEGASRKLTFVDDFGLAEGGYSYQVVAVRIVGQLVLEEVPPNDVDIFMKWLAGLGLAPSLDFSTPGMSFEVPGGFNGTRQVQIGGISGDALQTVLNPVAKIFNGIRRQESPRSDALGVFVSSRPAQPPPPGSLVVDWFSNSVFLSIPVTRNIFKFTRDGVSSFADTNFALPNQTGLAIDGRGNLYTGNAASEAKFGGRVFRFQQPDGRRDHIGNVNKYSFLLQFAHPTSIQSLAVGPSPFGEALYVADGLANAIKRMFVPHTAPPGVDGNSNIGQFFARSDQFAFGPTTTLAFRGDGELFVNQGSDIFRISPSGSVSSLFWEVVEGNRPFLDIAGIAFDVFSNLYVADRVTGTITMIPPHQNHDGNTLFGASRIDLKKLTVTRGLRSPSEVKIAPDDRGLVFFDQERAVVFLPFGVSGQIVDANGQPIVGAEVLVRDRGRATVTDGDGVFVLSGLLQPGLSSAVDIVVRHDGRTQTFRVFLDPRRHNMADFTFDPPAPQPPADDPVPPPVPPPPPPPIEEDIDDETVTFPELRVRLSRLQPGVPPPPPPPPPGPVCPRAYFLRPGHRSATMSSPLGVTGFVTDAALTNGFVVVNGVAQSSTLVGGRFNEMVVLQPGDNALIFALPGAAAKAAGCAPQDTPDDAIVPISSSVNVFHDSTADVVRAIRLQRGFDVAVVGRIIDDETGVPITGITLGIPDTEIEAQTDRDGVFQLNIPLGGVNFATEAALGQAIASLDVMAAFELLEQIGGNFGGVLGGLKGTAANLISQLQINGIFETAIVGQILSTLEKPAVLGDLSGISGLVAKLLGENPHPVLQADLSILNGIAEAMRPKVENDEDPPRVEEEELQDQLKAIVQQQAPAFGQVHSLLECAQKSIRALLGGLQAEGAVQRVGLVASRLPLEAALERNPSLFDADAFEPCTTRAELIDSLSGAIVKHDEAAAEIGGSIARSLNRVIGDANTILKDGLSRLEAGLDPTPADLTQIDGLVQSSAVRLPGGSMGGLLGGMGAPGRIGSILSGLFSRQEGALSSIGGLVRNFMTQIPGAFLTPNLQSSVTAIDGNASGLLGRLLQNIDKTPQDTEQLRSLFEQLQTMLAELNKIMVQVSGTATQLVLNMR